MYIINRVRRMKESYAVTELRRAQNRMSFGVQEDEVSGIDSTEGLGLIRQSGKIRAFQNDPRTKSMYFYFVLIYFIYKR